MKTEHEPGVCVCCRATATLHFADQPNEPGWDVCEECRDDGTFKSFLDVQLRLEMVEMGCTFETRDGVEYAMPPKRLDDAK